nr:OmpA family protein [Neoroseomonas alba]
MPARRPSCARPGFGTIPSATHGTRWRLPNALQPSVGRLGAAESRSGDSGVIGKAHAHWIADIWRSSRQSILATFAQIDAFRRWLHPHCQVPSDGFQRPCGLWWGGGRGAAKPLLGLTLALSLALPAHAEPPAFNCVGAEQIEDDVYSVPFARGSARLGDAARTPMDSILEVMSANPDRPACVLGHAGQEGGATTSIRLAAERARAVSQALVSRGVAAARLRSEARSAHFSPRVRAALPPSRTVTVIVLPAAAPAEASRDTQTP